MKKIDTEKFTEPERIAWAINKCLRYQLAQAKRRLKRLKKSEKGRYQ